MNAPAAAGYVWTRDQLAAARSLRASALVADVELSHAYRADVVVDHTRRKLAAVLARTAEPHAIVLDPADLELTTYDEPAVAATRFGCRWAPGPDRDVEFYGGHHDGLLARVTYEHGAPPPIWRLPVPDSDAVAVDDYELAGWRENERRWVYQLRRLP